MHKGRPAAYGHQRGKGNDNNAAGLGLALPGVLDETQRKRKIKTPRTWPPQRWSNHAMQVLWLRSWQQQARNHHLDMQNVNTSGLGSCWCTDAYWCILMHWGAWRKHAYLSGWSFTMRSNESCQGFHSGLKLGALQPCCWLCRDS